MAKQLNVRSDAAHRLATQLSRRLNLSTTKVVEQALMELDRKVPEPAGGDLPPDQEADHRAFMELVRSVQRFKKPGATSDHSDLYDENGLPA